jgi:curli biogenesis system outer membrane secretion channel CsgG
MMYRKRNLFILAAIGLLLVLSLLAGCKKNDARLLTGKRVGVYVETATGSRMNISSIIVNQLNRKIQDVNAVSVLSTDLSGNDTNALKRLKKELNLDYLAMVKILSLQVGEKSPIVDISKQRVGLTRQYECNVALNFRLLELNKLEVVLIGETQGNASSSEYYGVSRDGSISIGQGSKSEENRLIEAAIIDALNHSNLIK